MLITISTSELRLGMYVALIPASWWNHPFWRRSFLLRRADDLQKIRASGIVSIVIDDSRGVGVDAIEAPALLEPTLPTAPSIDVLPSWSAERPARAARRKDDPASRAAETVQRSKAAVERMFNEARLGHAIRADDVAPFVDEIAASVARNPSAIIKVCRLKTKDEYTYLHSVAVCALMIHLGRKLGLEDTELRQVGMAGLLHDIGKMAIPEAILDKPGRLDDDEYGIVRTHVVRGHKILSRGGDVSTVALDVCLHHHERMDGTGYPFGLAADQLSLHVRMAAVCDVYDAVTSHRSYKPAWAPMDALSRMVAWEGHFDPRILSTFIRGIGIYPIGSLVRLRSNRLAMVVAGNDDEPTLPIVRPFFEVPDFMFVRVADVQTGSEAEAESIMGPEDGSRWFGENWPAVASCIVRNERPPDTLNIDCTVANGLV